MVGIQVLQEAPQITGRLPFRTHSVCVNTQACYSVYLQPGCKLTRTLSPWLSAQKEEFPLLGVDVKVNLSQEKTRVDFGRSSNIYFLNHASVSEASEEALQLFPSVAALWLQQEEREHNLKRTSSSNT